MRICSNLHHASRFHSFCRWRHDGNRDNFSSNSSSKLLRHNKFCDSICIWGSGTSKRMYFVSARLALLSSRLHFEELRRGQSFCSSSPVISNWRPPYLRWLPAVQLAGCKAGCTPSQTFDDPRRYRIRFCDSVLIGRRLPKSTK